MGTNINKTDLLKVITAVEEQLGVMDVKQPTFAEAKQKVTDASFGGYPGAQVVLQAHDRSHATAISTLNNVRTKLEDFAQALTTALADFDTADGLSEVGFRKIIDAGLVASEGTQQDTGDSQWNLNDEKTEPRDESVPVPVPDASTDGSEVCSPEESA